MSINRSEFHDSNRYLAVFDSPPEPNWYLTPFICGQSICFSVIEKVRSCFQTSQSDNEIVSFQSVVVENGEEVEKCKTIEATKIIIEYEEKNSKNYLKRLKIDDLLLEIPSSRKDKKKEKPLSIQEKIGRGVAYSVLIGSGLGATFWITRGGSNVFVYQAAGAVPNILAKTIMVNVEEAEESSCVHKITLAIQSCVTPILRKSKKCLGITNVEKTALLTSQMIIEGTVTALIIGGVAGIDYGLFPRTSWTTSLTGATMANLALPFGFKVFRFMLKNCFGLKGDD